MRHNGIPFVSGPQRRAAAAAGLCGHDETRVKVEVEADVALRLAALETDDPAQQRPTPRTNVNNRVDYIEL